MLPCNHLLPTQQQKHHLFWSVWPHQCSHVISIWTAAAGLWLDKASILDCGQDFNQFRRWYLTRHLDQRAHRVSTASSVKLPPGCVSVFPLVSIALPHSGLHKHTHMYEITHTQWVIIAETTPLLPFNFPIKLQRGACYSWGGFFFFLLLERSFPMRQWPGNTDLIFYQTENLKRHHLLKVPLFNIYD